jgi:hypothetical protein
MRMTLPKIASLPLAMAAVLVLACGTAAATTSPTPPTTCFWSSVTDPQTNNIDFPDTNATYWYSRYQLPPGGKVVLHGSYPYARYFSINAYATVAGRGGSPTDALHDSQINPDRGSHNPFLPWALRIGRHGTYTVTLSGNAAPSDPSLRQPNTLYTGQAGQTATTQTIEIVYRVYVPDIGRDATGGAGLPQPTFTPTSGPSLTGAPLCAALGNNNAQLPNLAIPAATYNQLLGLSPLSTHPAVDPAVWYAFFNTQRLAEPFYAGTPAAGLIATLPTARTGGLYSNADNSYVYSYIDRTFGPDRSGHNILVLHGKMPTTPHTFLREPLMQGNTQLRYWSLCQNESIASGAVASPCLNDEQVPLDSNRDYTIVVSLPEDRPANATARCGVAWLNWGTTGDGFSRPDTGFLIMRNMLPDPSFTQTPANVLVPGTESSVMGPYLPSETYESSAQFSSQRCGAR